MQILLFLLIAIAASLPKSGGGSGGGRGSSGGSSSSRPSSSNSNSRGTSSSSSSSSGSKPPVTNTGTTTRPNSARPGTSSSHSTRGSSSNAGSRTVRDTFTSYPSLRYNRIFGYPSTPLFYSYGWNPYYQGYLLGSARSHPSLKDSDCINFASNDFDSQSVTAPAKVTDTFNFYGNASLSSSNLVLEYTAPLADFVKVNPPVAGPLENRVANTFIAELWQKNPQVSLNRLEMTTTGLTLTGSIFSSSELLVYSGSVSSSNSNFIISGKSLPLESFNMTASLLNVNLQIVNETDTFKLVFRISGSSTISLRNANLTTGNEFIANAGSFSFLGATVALEGCEGNAALPKGLSALLAFALVLLYL